MGFFGNTLYRNSQNVLSYVVMKTTWIGFENIREAVVRQAQSACGMEENMSYKIVVDSCCELPEKYKKDPHFEIVPLGLEVGDYRIMDDEHFNQKEFLEQVASCPQCPRSSCPSPESYRQAFESEAEHIYVVTLSGNLSGSYNSAMVGRQMYLEEDESKQIYVMDSCSASCGETQLALLAASLEEQGLPFEEVVSRLEAFRSEMNTYFVLDNLETLRKTADSAVSRHWLHLL